MSTVMRVLTALLAAAGWVTMAPVDAADLALHGRLLLDGTSLPSELDLQLRLYGSASANDPIQPAAEFTGVAHRHGRFTIQIDLGDTYAHPHLWLQVGARASGTAGAYQILDGRLPLAPVAHADTVVVVDMAEDFPAASIGATSVRARAVIGESVNPNAIQLRVQTACQPGSAMGGIDEAGVPVCVAAEPGPPGPEGPPGHGVRTVGDCSSQSSQCTCANPIASVNAIGPSGQCYVRTTIGSCGRVFGSVGTNYPARSCCVCTQTY